MLPGFEKIVEERIKEAKLKGEFNDLPGSGKPLELEDDSHISEELRIAYKILKNANFLPPEIELKKEIIKTEELLAGTEDISEKYHVLKKLNFLVAKFNSIRNTRIEFELPEFYFEKIVDHYGRKPWSKNKK